MRLNSTQERAQKRAHEREGISIEPSRFQIDPQLYPNGRYPIPVYGWRNYQREKRIPEIAEKISTSRNNLHDAVSNYLDLRNPEASIRTDNTELILVSTENFDAGDLIEKIKTDFVNSNPKTRHIVLARFSEADDDIIAVMKAQLEDKLEVLVADFTPTFCKNGLEKIDYTRFSEIRES